MRPIFVLIDEDDKVMEIVGVKTFYIGSSQYSDLQRVNGAEHLQCTIRILCRFEAEVVLHDHSEQGTYVNGDRVNEQILINAGDKISFAGTDLTFQIIR